MQKGEVMTDRDLLELAAKAAGAEYEVDEAAGEIEVLSEIGGVSGHWNPLEDDGDALRLANALGISIIHTYCLDDAPVVKVGYYSEHEKLEEHPAFPDENKETRRAITRAAAEIGKHG